jgi:hypothetical protein
MTKILMSPMTVPLLQLLFIAVLSFTKGLKQHQACMKAEELRSTRQLW